MPAIDTAQVRKDALTRIKEIDIEVKRIGDLRQERDALQRLVDALKIPGNPQKKPEKKKIDVKKEKGPAWTSELKKYFISATKLATHAQITDAVCEQMDIVKTAEVSRNIYAILSKLNSQSAVGSVAETESGRRIFGPMEFFSDNKTLKPEYAHLAELHN